MKLVDLQNRNPFGPHWGARRRGKLNLEGQGPGGGAPKNAEGFLRMGNASTSGAVFTLFSLDTETPALGEPDFWYESDSGNSISHHVGNEYAYYTQSSSGDVIVRRINVKTRADEVVGIIPGAHSNPRIFHSRSSDFLFIRTHGTLRRIYRMDARTGEPILIDDFGSSSTSNSISSFDEYGGSLYYIGGTPNSGRIREYSFEGDLIRESPGTVTGGSGIGFNVYSACIVPEREWLVAAHSGNLFAYDLNTLTRITPALRSIGSSFGSGMVLEGDWLYVNVTSTLLARMNIHTLEWQNVGNSGNPRGWVLI